MKKVVRRPKKKIIVPKNCFFCMDKKEPGYDDVRSLQKFLTERGKIIGRSRNGLCSMHQNHLTVAIKHARHLSLLSFVVRD